MIIAFADSSVRLFEEVFSLIEDGHVRPIHPILVFGFEEVVEALSHIRRGNHIGKIVVSHYGQDDIQLHIKPAMRQLSLQSSASYLIVGGLKGICGSIALNLARHGARQLIIVSRSGLGNDESQKVIEDCNAHGCTVKEAKGDVCDLDFVRQTFASTEGQAIIGVVQGAMLLKVSRFFSILKTEGRSSPTIRIGLSK